MSRERAECSGHPRFYSPPDRLVPYHPQPQSPGNFRVSPAAVSERGELGVRGGLHPPELGLGQFRLCSPSGGGDGPDPGTEAVGKDLGVCDRGVEVD